MRYERGMVESKRYVDRRVPLLYLLQSSNAGGCAFGRRVGISQRKCATCMRYAKVSKVVKP